MMQFYRVNRTCSVMVGRIRVDRDPPPRDPEHPQRIATSHIFCGQVHWEIRAIKEVCGEDAVEVVPQAQVMHLLPTEILPSSEGRSLGYQLQALSGVRAIYRIVLINGAGTMLGDNLVGAGVFHRLQSLLYSQGIDLRLTVVLGANAAQGSVSLWKRWQWVDQVEPCGVSLRRIQTFDAMLDFSRLLRKDGYSSENFFDFYLHHYGADRALFPPASRNPAIRIQRKALEEAKAFLAPYSRMRLVLLQSKASTEARSMPMRFVHRLLKHVLNCQSDGSVIVMIFGTIPEGLEDHHEQILCCDEFTRHALDRYLALISLADRIMTVDSLALHVAMGLNKQGDAYFSLSPPEIRLRYAPQINGYLIPGAQALPYWGKHKSDETWSGYAALYEQAWERLEVDPN